MLLFETESCYVAQAGLELTTKLGLALNLRSSQSAGITDVDHYTGKWFIHVICHIRVSFLFKAEEDSVVCTLPHSGFLFVALFFGFFVIVLIFSTIFFY